MRAPPMNQTSASPARSSASSRLRTTSIPDTSSARLVTITLRRPEIGPPEPMIPSGDSAQSMALMGAASSTTAHLHGNLERDRRVRLVAAEREVLHDRRRVGVEQGPQVVEGPDRRIDGEPGQ